MGFQGYYGAVSSQFLSGLVQRVGAEFFELLHLVELLASVPPMYGIIEVSRDTLLTFLDYLQPRPRSSQFWTGFLICRTPINPIDC